MRSQHHPSEHGAEGSLAAWGFGGGFLGGRASFEGGRACADLGKWPPRKSPRRAGRHRPYAGEPVYAQKRAECGEGRSSRTGEGLPWTRVDRRGPPNASGEAPSRMWRGSVQPDRRGHVIDHGGPEREALLPVVMPRGEGGEGRSSRTGEGLPLTRADERERVTRPGGGPDPGEGRSSRNGEGLPLTRADRRERVGPAGPERACH